MTTTLGAFEWSTTRGNPASGQVTLASDPVAGYSNTLRVSETDAAGNDRGTALSTVVAGDVILVAADFAFVVGTPVDSGAFRSFPVTLTNDFDDDNDEPDNEDEVQLLRRAAGTWPNTTELAQVLNLGSDGETDWDTTLDRVLASAINRVKSDTGNWSDNADSPSNNQAQAALRMAFLMWTSPDSPAFGLDPSYRGLMTGQRRRFGIA